MPLTPERREQLRQEHYEKFDKLAHKLGWAEVLALVPKPLEEIRQALDEGDEHLNKWGNGPWDAAVGRGPAPKVKARLCPTCGHTNRPKPPKVDPYGTLGAMRKLFNRARLGHSWSDGNCVLKHVAKVEALKL